MPRETESKRGDADFRRGARAGLKEQPFIVSAAFAMRSFSFLSSRPRPSSYSFSSRLGPDAVWSRARDRLRGVAWRGEAWRGVARRSAAHETR